MNKKYSLRELCLMNNHYKECAYGINTRCPWCGDSKKPHHLKNYGQCYIFKDGFVKCFRCGKYDTFNNFLAALCKTVGVSYQKHLETDAKYNYTRSFFFKKTNKFEPKPLPIEKNRGKISYIEQRLGRNLDEDEIRNIRLILDGDNSYVSFLSWKKTKIIKRFINSKNHRWKIQNIDKNSSHVIDFWAEDDFLEKVSRNKTVVLAEGVMDVLHDRILKRHPNQAKVAWFGKYRIRCVIENIFIETALKLNYIIYRDFDFDLKDMINTIRPVKHLMSTAIIYSPLGGKDAADPKTYGFKAYYFL